MLTDDTESYIDSECCEGGIRYLSVEALKKINRYLILLQTPQEPIGVLKPGELESSQQRPANYRYHGQTEDMYALAAVLMESLVLNHSFTNANKRTAAVAGFMFLLLNGYELTAPGPDLVEILVGISCKDYSCEELEAWLAHWGRDFDCSQLNEGLEGASKIQEFADSLWSSDWDIDPEP